MLFADVTPAIVIGARSAVDRRPRRSDGVPESPSFSSACNKNQMQRADNNSGGTYNRNTAGRKRGRSGKWRGRARAVANVFIFPSTVSVRTDGRSVVAVLAIRTRVSEQAVCSLPAAGAGGGYPERVKGEK